MAQWQSGRPFTGRLQVRALLEAQIHAGYMLCLCPPVSPYAGACENGPFLEGLGCVISSICGRAIFPHSIPKLIRGISPYAGRAAARLSSRVSVGHFIFTCRGCEGVIFEGVRRMLVQLLSNHFRAPNFYCIRQSGFDFHASFGRYGERLGDRCLFAAAGSACGR